MWKRGLPNGRANSSLTYRSQSTLRLFLDGKIIKIGMNGLLKTVVNQYWKTMILLKKCISGKQMLNVMDYPKILCV